MRLCCWPADRFAGLAGGTPSVPTHSGSDSAITALDAVTEGKDETADETASTAGVTDADKEKRVDVVFTTDIFFSADVYVEVPQESDEAQRFLGKGVC